MTDRPRCVCVAVNAQAHVSFCTSTSMKHTRARAALPLRQPWSGATVTSARRDAGVTTSFATAPAFSTHSTVVLSGACSLRRRHRGHRVHKSSHRQHKSSMQPVDTASHHKCTSHTDKEATSVIDTASRQTCTSHIDKGANGAYLKETSPHARGQPGKSRIRRPSAVRGSAGEAVCISMSCTVVRCFAAVPGYLGPRTNTPRDWTGGDGDKRCGEAYGSLSPNEHSRPAGTGPSGPIAGSVLQFQAEKVP